MSIQNETSNDMNSDGTTLMDMDALLTHLVELDYLTLLGPFSLKDAQITPYITLLSTIISSNLSSETRKLDINVIFAVINTGMQVIFLICRVDRIFEAVMYCFYPFDHGILHIFYGVLSIFLSFFWL